MGLLRYAVKLTESPADCGEGDIAALRALGWDDPAISDAIEVCAFFNYINRIAEGMGVDPERWLGPDGRPLESPDPPD